MTLYIVAVQYPYDAYFADWSNSAALLFKPELFIQSIAPIADSTTVDYSIQAMVEVLHMTWTHTTCLIYINVD